MNQRDFYELLPGVPGGRKLRDQRGVEYLRQLGQRGGMSTRDRYGAAHLRQLGQRGGYARAGRLYAQARTIRAWDGFRYRVIPWWPHQRRRQRRKRPVFVRVELD
jgi:hypothetical protein